MPVDINQLALLGVGAVITVMILALLAQVGLSYLAQRNLNDQLSIGLQAIVGTNNIRTVDQQLDDGAKSPGVTVDNRGTNSDDT